jgi:hypothetical protein
VSVPYAAVMSETATESPKWLTYAWVGLTMVALLVLALYSFYTRDTGDQVLFPLILLGFGTLVGALGVGFLKRDGSLGILLLRVATMIAIVGIITFQF